MSPSPPGPRSTQVDHARAGRRCGPRGPWPRATRRGVRRPWARADRVRAAEPVGASMRPVDDRGEPLAQTRRRGRLSATSHTETAVPVDLRPGAGGAHRARCSGEHRRRRRRAGRPGRAATTVTGEPSAEAAAISTDTAAGSRRTASGTGSDSAGATCVISAPSACPARETRRSTSDARHVVHAAGEAARASASVSARSSSRLAASGTWVSSSAVVAGSSGSRVVARSASSRCQRTREATTSASRSVKPIRATTLRARGSPATEWSCSEPLPMSCSSAATSSRSGRRTLRIRGAPRRRSPRRAGRR